MKQNIFCATIAVFLWSSSTTAAPLPQLLLCKPSGFGTCPRPGEEGICIGGGTRDKSIQVILNVKAHSINLNGITGRIDMAPDEDITSDGKYDIIWKWQLIGLKQLLFRNDDEKKITLALTDGEFDLEFACAR